jgi:Ca-activated chloride channel family protein
MDLSYLDKFNCIGTYADAETKDAFRNVLKNVVSKALLNTTVQINLNDIYKNPKETDVTMLLYEAGTKNLKYTFIHTINRFGNPDTLIIDPSLKYDLLVNTIPKVEKKNIILQRNIHNTIILDAPQGFINVRFINATKPYSIETRVMQHGEGRTLNIQQMNVSDKYIVGKYNLEILTLPRIYMNLDVTQSSTVNADILAPGLLTYRSSSQVIAQLFLVKENGEIEWVFNLDQTLRNSSVHLQPGNYRLVYRQKSLKSSSYTIDKNFRIYSNKTTTITI